MHINVHFFATLRDLTGERRISLEIPDSSTVQDLKTYLKNKYPAGDHALELAIASINQEFAFDDDPIPVNSEVALFPPVSGGSKIAPHTFVSITEDKIDFNALLARVTISSTGATCIFSGMVRAVTPTSIISRTEYLEYETYHSMAESKMNQIANEIRKKWPDVEGIAIVQRTGVLYPGTPTVIIACSAAHRDSGIFEAAKYGIDRLKEIVPVWKREVGPQGESWVEGEYFPNRAD